MDVELFTVASTLVVLHRRLLAVLAFKPVMYFHQLKIASVLATSCHHGLIAIASMLADCYLL